MRTLRSLLIAVWNWALVLGWAGLAGCQSEQVVYRAMCLEADRLLVGTWVYQNSTGRYTGPDTLQVRQTGRLCQYEVLEQFYYIQPSAGLVHRWRVQAIESDGRLYSVRYTVLHATTFDDVSAAETEAWLWVYTSSHAAKTPLVLYHVGIWNRLWKKAGTPIGLGPSPTYP